MKQLRIFFLCLVAATLVTACGGDDKDNSTPVSYTHLKKGSEHSHTTVEFQLIHLLNHVLVTDSGLIPTFAVAALSLLCILFIRPQVEPYHRSCPGVISLRAPPVA